MKRHFLLFSLCTLLAASSASAQEWAKKMFEVTAHDFGTVAKGTRAEYRFHFKNLYNEDVHVVGVRTSCGCTTPSVNVGTLKTFQEGEVLAHFNTDTFVGVRHATLTVTIDRPYPAEVQLDIRGTIRTDVAMSPELVDFGQVDAGTAAERQLRVTYLGGTAGWRITDATTQSSNLSVKVTPVNGTPQPTYDLHVALKPGTPAGSVKEPLKLVTNEPNGAPFVVEVEGNVMPQVTVSPSSLFLGTTHVNGDLTKTIAVRSKRPIHILKVTSDDPAFTAKVPDAAQQLHMIPITFAAAGRTGTISTKLHITTDAEDSKNEAALVVVVSAEVISAPQPVATTPE